MAPGEMATCVVRHPGSVVMIQNGHPLDKNRRPTAEESLVSPGPQDHQGAGHLGAGLPGEILKPPKIVTHAHTYDAGHSARSGIGAAPAGCSLGSCCVPLGDDSDSRASVQRGCFWGWGCRAQARSSLVSAQAV
jgi:hypothetical protein